jgi:hypothetical protein
MPTQSRAVPETLCRQAGLPKDGAQRSPSEFTMEWHDDGSAVGPAKLVVTAPVLTESNPALCRLAGPRRPRAAAPGAGLTRRFPPRGSDDRLRRVHHWRVFEVELERLGEVGRAASTLSPWLVTSTWRYRATYQSPSRTTAAVTWPMVGSAMPGSESERRHPGQGHHSQALVSHRCGAVPRGRMIEQLTGIATIPAGVKLRGSCCATGWAGACRGLSVGRSNAVSRPLPAGWRPTGHGSGATSRWLRPRT